MKFLVLVKPGLELAEGQMPKRELIEAMGAFNEQLANDGILLAAEGVWPSSKGTRLRFEGGQATVIDGPFAETKELVGGFWIVKGTSREEIVARFAHAPCEDGYVLEIRKLIEPEDFGDLITPEERERYQRVEF